MWNRKFLVIFKIEKYKGENHCNSRFLQVFFKGSENLRDNSKPKSTLVDGIP